MPNVISDLVAGYTIAVRSIRDWVIYLFRSFREPKTRRILSEFCAEAAVLIFVFPVLDTVVEGRRAPGMTQTVSLASQNGSYGATLGVGIWSAVFAIIFIVIAIILAEKKAGTEE